MTQPHEDVSLSHAIENITCQIVNMAASFRCKPKLRQSLEKASSVQLLLKYTSHSHTVNALQAQRAASPSKPTLYNPTAVQPEKYYYQCCSKTNSYDSHHFQRYWKYLGLILPNFPELNCGIPVSSSKVGRGKERMGRDFLGIAIVSCSKGGDFVFCVLLAVHTCLQHTCGTRAGGCTTACHESVLFLKKNPLPYHPGG